MKKILISLLCLAVLASMYACVNSGGLFSGQPGETSDQGTEPGAVTFQKAALEDLSADIRNSVRLDRADQGYDILHSGADFYLVVYAGERPTGGYAVNITAITSDGGETRVTVRETVPAQDEMVTQALTYPFDIVKLEKDINGGVKLEFIK
jgi:hypothetical protein